ncbi:MAG: dephospho-CoA kinase [Candidatus Pacebacteria bacterium]|nr:dephospho-CoA kinase [Candidatus Paceibacterota bacterium]
MRAFGLTGDIGCGKSTVSNILSKYPDVSVFDCDKIAKEILGDIPRDEIIAILGVNVFPQGTLDFKMMSEIIFRDQEKKGLLEDLVHPLVWVDVQEKVNSTNPNNICVVESAIIFETESACNFLAMIVVVCSKEEQFRRLRENRHMSDKQILDRINQQLPSYKKEQQADFVIQTGCSIPELKRRVATLYHNLKNHKGNLA